MKTPKPPCFSTKQSLQILIVGFVLFFGFQNSLQAASAYLYGLSSYVGSTKIRVVASGNPNLIPRGENVYVYIDGKEVNYLKTEDNTLDQTN